MTDTFVSCVVGDAEFALQATDIVAVMRADRMRAPGASGGIGTVTLGGDSAPVHALGPAMGLCPQGEDVIKGRDRHIVILRGTNGPVAWLVDRVGRSRLPVRTRVLPLPSAVGAHARRWFGGVLSTDERTLLLLSLSDADRHGASNAADAAGTPAAGRSSAPTAFDSGPLVVTFGSEALPPCGATRYAISARRVAGLESALHIAPVPGSELPVIGVSVWRGEAVPVVHFGETARAGAMERCRLLIVRCAGSPAGTSSVAIPVDAETALHQPTDDNQPVGPADAGRVPFVAGLFDVRGHSVALIDPDLLMMAVAAAAAA